MKKRPILLFLAMTWQLGTAQSSQPSIGVASFQLQDIDSSQGSAYVEALATELKNTGKFRVMERTQMDKILQEQGFQQSGACDNSGCVTQVGQLLSVDAMVIGSIRKLDGTTVFNVRLVDVGSGEVRVTLNRSSAKETADILSNTIPFLAKGIADPDGPFGTAYRPTETPVIKSTEDDQGSGVWPWVLGGIAVVGTVVAVLVLSDSDDGSDGSSQNTESTETQIHFTW